MFLDGCFRRTPISLISKRRDRAGIRFSGAAGRSRERGSPVRGWRAVPAREMTVGVSWMDSSAAPSRSKTRPASSTRAGLSGMRTEGPNPIAEIPSGISEMSQAAGFTARPTFPNVPRPSAMSDVLLFHRPGSSGNAVALPGTISTAIAMQIPTATQKHRENTFASSRILIRSLPS